MLKFRLKKSKYKIRELGFTFYIGLQGILERVSAVRCQKVTCYFKFSITSEPKKYRAQLGLKMISKAGRFVCKNDKAITTILFGSQIVEDSK